MSDMHMAPFLRQQAIAVNRVARPEDSISNVSFSSWTRVADHAEKDDLELPPPDLELPHVVDLDNKVKVGQPDPGQNRSIPTVAQAQPATPRQGQDPVPKSAPARNDGRSADSCASRGSSTASVEGSSGNTSCSELACWNQPSIWIQKAAEASRSGRQERSSWSSVWPAGWAPQRAQQCAPSLPQPSRIGRWREVGAGG